MFYSNVLGVKKDYKKAMKYYLLAAEQNHDVVQNNIGVLYEHGRGVEKDLSEAKNGILRLLYWEIRRQ